MGSAASVGVEAALKDSTEEDLKQCLSGLSPEVAAKLLAACKAADPEPKAPSSPPLIPSVQGKEGGKTLLVIIGSPMGTHSASTTVGKAFCKAYSEKFPEDSIKVIDTLSLAPFTAARVQAKFKCFGGDASAADDNEEWMYTKKLIDEFKSADKYAILAPMWNFWIPNHLKLYIDHIVQPALTFTPDGKGMVTGKPLLFVRASGGVPIGSDMDLGTKYLKAVFGFVGFTDMRVVGITGTANQEGLPALLEEKSKEAAEVAATFEFDADAKPDSCEAPAIAETDPAELKEGAKVLFITSSPLGDNSATRKASKAFIEKIESAYKATVTTLDLAADPTPPFMAAGVQAKFATWMGGPEAGAKIKEWESTTKLIDQFKANDVYIFAVPMWNLAVPNQLKCWFDHVCQPHLTFDASTQTGLLEGKRAFVIACSGNSLLGTPFDHVTPFMKTVLGFVGVTDVTYSFVQGMDGVSEAVAKLNAGVKLEG